MQLLVDKSAHLDHSIVPTLNHERETENGLFAIYQFNPNIFEGDIRKWLQKQWQNGVTTLIWPEKKYKAIFFDMDSTAVAQESIVELARFTGKQNELKVAEITENAMQGRCSFDEALRQRVAVLKGQPASIIDQAILNLTINPGLDSLCQEAKKKQVKLFLISGGFIEMAAHVAKSLSMDGFLANRLGRAQDQLTGQVEGDLINANAKAQYLEQMCALHHFKPEDCIAVGDGANDLEMLKISGLPIGYHPKAKLWPSIHGAMFHSFLPLTEIINS